MLKNLSQILGLAGFAFAIAICLLAGSDASNAQNSKQTASVQPTLAAHFLLVPGQGAFPF